MITQSSKEALVSRLDIFDTVSSYIELKKAGGSFKACCPFHDENTPSFAVTPSKGIAHCFGSCGKSWDSVQFVMDYENLDFVEACEKLARSINFTLKYERGYTSNTSSIDILSKASSYFQEQLTQEHHDYLKKRGINKESIQKWEIGYAGKTPEQIAFFTRSQIPLDEAHKVGLLAHEKEKRYARFTKRLMFPIKSASGKVVGFSGRIIGDDTRGAKYLNTPQTPLFDKSSILYGWSEAKEAIYKKGTVVILEGQVDVILAHQAGIRTAVANLGTAFTDQHISTIKKANAKVLLGYDGDQAGIAAAYRASLMLAKEGVEGGVVIFEEGQDPADLVASGQSEKLFEALKKPIMIVRFVLQMIVQQYNTKNPHEQEKALAECVAFLSSLKSHIVAEHHRGVVAQLVGVDMAFVQLGNIAKKPPITATESKNIAEVSIIKSILEHAALGDIAVDIMNDEAMSMQREYRLALQGQGDELVELTLDDAPIYTGDAFTKAVLLHQKAYLQKRQREQAMNASLKELEEMAFQIKKLDKLIKELS